MPHSDMKADTQPMSAEAINLKYHSVKFTSLAVRVSGWHPGIESTAQVELYNHIVSVKVSCVRTRSVNNSDKGKFTFTVSNFM